MKALFSVVLFLTHLMGQFVIGVGCEGAELKQEENMRKTSHFGTWDSPITADLVARGTKRFSNIVIDGKDVYWDEMRPSEGGRYVIVRSSKEGEVKDMTPKGYNVRTRVHEYGGGAYTAHQGKIYFVNDADQQIYVQHNENVSLLTKGPIRYADPRATEKGLFAIAEDHKNEAAVENTLVWISFESGKVTTLAKGEDFYSSPSLSPDGKKLAWLSWNHPDMPWDGATVWIADFDQGELKNSYRIAGGKGEAVFQPQWSPDGTLYFIFDKSGWWNIYRYSPVDKVFENICPMSAEFGLPGWVFGMSTYAFAGSKILCTYHQEGAWHLSLLDPSTRAMKKIPLAGTFYSQIRSTEDFAAFIEGSATQSKAVLYLDLKTSETKVLACNEKPEIASGYYSTAVPVTFSSKGGRQAHAFYYPPLNKDYQGLQGELPPLIVKAHGGPTAAVSSAFELSIQYWTSRGFAVLDVNYGGSTGYGRDYRNLLNGNWGIVDREDCEYGAKHCVDKGWVDSKKLAITGGSAGGYTTLCALTFGKVFSVGASYFGVSDLELLTKETHKFESHYLEKLVGPYPKNRDTYLERSPAHFPEKLNFPVIFLQGLEDKIVLPNQAEELYEALKKRGVHTELVLYQGEQHGFRKAETIKDALEKELQFYLSVFFPTGPK